MASDLYGLLPRTPGRTAAPEGGADLARLPASAQAVYRILEARGPLTHKDLVQVAGMPDRTLRWALKRLRAEGVVGARCSLMDCRQCYFYVQRLCAGNGLHGTPVQQPGG